MPVRKVGTSHRSITGVLSTHKSVGPARYESTLERDHLRLLRFDPCVKSFEVQPITFSWLEHAGKSHRYTPDVLVHYTDDRIPVLVEIKYRDEIKENPHWFRDKFRAARSFAQNMGWGFHLLTELNIRGLNGARLKNIHFLEGFMDWSATAAEQAAIQSAIAQTKVRSPAGVLATLPESAQSWAIGTLWYLIASGKVQVDMSRPLTMNSPLWNPNGHA